MEIRVRATALGQHKDEAAVVFATKGQDVSRTVASAGKAFEAGYALLADKKAFDGDVKQVRVLTASSGQRIQLLVLAGLGPAKEVTAEVLTQASSAAIRAARDAGARSVSVVVPSGRGAWQRPDRAAQAIAEGARIGAYRFENHKSEKARTVLDAVTLLAPRGGTKKAEAGADHGAVIGEGVCLARDLGNEPGNVATPTHLAEVAQLIAAEEGLEVEILEREDLQRLGMGAFLGVAKGSAEPPKMIVLTYEPPRRRTPPPTVALVGKGLTFDSGGISIKPSAKMEDMKFDMCGGAAVLGTMKAVARLGIPVRVVGLVGATENMPGGHAYKPGDVLEAMNGTTIEVRNTDAEGRLVLADVLAYATTKLKPKPKAVIDLATLTGACLVALGDQHAGLMGNDEALLDRIRRAASSSGDAVWALPLTAGYRKQLESPYADVSNLGTPGAGTITAAAFLEKFTHKVPWAHLDIAGMAWTEKQSGTFTKGATGFGVRLLCHLLADWERE